MTKYNHFWGLSVYILLSFVKYLSDITDYFTLSKNGVFPSRWNWCDYIIFAGIGKQRIYTTAKGSTKKVRRRRLEPNQASCLASRQLGLFGVFGGYNHNLIVRLWGIPQVLPIEGYNNIKKDPKEASLCRCFSIDYSNGYMDKKLLNDRLSSLWSGWWGNPAYDLCLAMPPRGASTWY